MEKSTSTLNFSYSDLNCIIKNLPIFKKRYTILNILKVNNKRAVYKAYDEENKKNVILKFILKNSTNSRLLKIYEFVRTHPHDNINKVLEIGEIGMFYLITLEFLDGKTMLDYFDQNISKSDVHKVFFELIFAVEYLHTCNIFHGDIKPDNIIVKNNGIPILIDFDLTRVVKDRLVVKRCFGTREFMSPEMVYNHICSLKSDIWSLGINFYLCLTKIIPQFPNPDEYNYTLFNENIEFYFKKYGRMIVNTVQLMCTFDDENRPDIYLIAEGIKQSKYFKKLYDFPENYDKNKDELQRVASLPNVHKQTGLTPRRTPKVIKHSRSDMQIPVNQRISPPSHRRNNLNINNNSPSSHRRSPLSSVRNTLDSEEN